MWISCRQTAGEATFHPRTRSVTSYANRVSRESAWKASLEFLRLFNGTSEKRDFGFSLEASNFVHTLLGFCWMTLNELCLENFNIVVLTIFSSVLLNPLKSWVLIYTKLWVLIYQFRVFFLSTFFNFSGKFVFLKKFQQISKVWKIKIGKFQNAKKSTLVHTLFCCKKSKWIEHAPQKQHVPENALLSTYSYRVIARRNKVGRSDKKFR